MVRYLLERRDSTRKVRKLKKEKYEHSCIGSCEIIASLSIVQYHKYNPINNQINIFHNTDPYMLIKVAAMKSDTLYDENHYEADRYNEKACKGRCFEEWIPSKLSYHIYLQG